MPSLTRPVCLVFCCFVLSVWAGNYTYYDGFAYNSTTPPIASQTASNQTLSNCVCQCLLTSGCSTLTFNNGTQTCSLFSDRSITEDEVTLTTGSTLLLVNAAIVS